jgi:pseudouridine kinase
MNKKIVVIGGMNVDILASSYQTFQSFDSNPGTHIIDAGGVGFNIAYNLRLLDYHLTFFTVIGQDQLGTFLKSDCLSQNIEVYSPPSKSSSLYLSLFNEHGDMQGAIASMDAMEHLTTAFLKDYEQKLLEADVIICDTNVSIEVLTYISKLHHLFKVIELVSKEKAIKIKNISSGFHFIKGNHDEISHLFHKSIQASLEDHQTVIMTNQVQHASLITRDQITTYKINKEKDIINTSGAGDAFLVGCIDGYFKNIDMLKQGHLMSLCALKSKNSKMLKECADAYKNQ